jgi:hypothetical protein
MVPGVCGLQEFWVPKVRRVWVVLDSSGFFGCAQDDSAVLVWRRANTGVYPLSHRSAEGSVEMTELGVEPCADGEVLHGRREVLCQGREGS